MRRYEGMFIFDESLKDDALQDAVNVVTAELERQGGTMLAQEILGRRQFARPMGKKQAGRYVRLFFELDPAKVAALRERLALREEVFRAQIVTGDGSLPEPESGGADAAREEVLHDA